MIETHAHLHDKAYDDDRQAMIERARGAGVDELITIGTDLEDSARAAQAAADFHCRWSLGIHPHEAKDAPEDIAKAFDAAIAAAATPPVAIGETGLDFHYDYSPRERQQVIFEAQVAYARDHDLPLIFHQREAFETFVETMRRLRFDGMRAVVHCFTGTPGEARTLVNEFGFYLGIGGVVTFKGADSLREAVRTVGVDSLVLETDCPYLTPMPHRGKRNEPAYLVDIVARLCELLVCSRPELISRTDQNAKTLFNL